jgi:hypothetical protein
MNPSQRLSVYDTGVERWASDALGPDDRKQVRISYRTGDMVAPALREQEALRTMLGSSPRASRGRAAATDGWAGLRVMRVLEAAAKTLRLDGAFVTLGDIE